MTGVPRVTPYHAAAVEALEAKALPVADVLARMSLHEQRVVVTYAKLSNHRRLAAPQPKKTLNP